MITAYWFTLFVRLAEIRKVDYFTWAPGTVLPFGGKAAQPAIPDIRSSLSVEKWPRISLSWV